MSILNVNKINPVGGGSTITIAGIASVTNNISVGNSVTAGSFVGPIEGNVTGNVTGNADTASGLSGNPSINTTGIVTATSFVPTTGQLSHRNIIINGAMNVAQRGTSSTSDGYNTVDRFNASQGSTDESPTFEQVDVASGTTPYTLGFRKAFKITNGNQTSGPQNGSEIQVLYNIEAQDIVQSGWNYKSSSSFITWSFWIKSSIATNFYGYLRTYDNTAIGYAFETGNLSANTWTKIVKTIPGNANIDINNDNGVGLQIRLLGYIGTSYSDNSTPLHTWTTYSSTARVPEPPTTWYTTNDATLEITGYQVEVGSVATPFEHRSFADELARCQRYYYRQSSEHQYMRYDCSGQCPSANGAQFVFSLPVKMRAVPTIGYSQLSDFYIYASNLQAKTPTNITLSAGSTKSPMLSFDKSSTFSAGAGAHLTVPNSNQGYIEFKAEL